MTLIEQEKHWYRNDGSKPTPRRKALNRADEFDNRGQNERAKKIRSIVISKDHGDDYDARRKSRNIKVDDNKVGKLPTAAKSDKRGAIDVKHNLKKLKEVAPPGYGHTKGDKEKGVKKGGTAAAFDKARKEGRFKGSKSDMFAIMWSQKNKGDKPHYKPGTDKKYKKYQESAVLDANTKIKKTEERKKKEKELTRLLKHAIAMKTGRAESFEIDTSAHKSAQKKAKMRNLARGNENPNEKAAAEKKAGGPKLYGEGKLTHLTKASVLGASDDPKDQDKAREIRTRFDYESLKKQIAKKKKPRKPAVKEEMTYQEAIDAGWEMSGEGIWMPPQTETVTEKISFPSFKKKVVERKPEKAQDAGAKARRAMKRREHAKYVSGSEDIVPDNIRD